jgi:hypothetical protein
LISGFLVSVPSYRLLLTSRPTQELELAVKVVVQQDALGIVALGFPGQRLVQDAGDA